ncbi:MAG: 2-oxo acid dehydrogenase subunit E2 [Chloroflexi bacterium]|nr:2-oxo acid dehydrogenase subunit E2 [Chloroflexota bacterium]MBT4073943.1 2-oxo acid dehydrogenase subunit E2 [Chloroflexota bacterium]MBT4514826.1 2-oxo acid dehydrogenase subunit E2 [Chloroflexota bacterium]
MITEVVMPAMGADMTEGTVVKWLKSEGDEVSRGDILAEIETDKTVVEMEAYGSGLLRKIVIGEGTKVPVGDLIAYIGDADDDVPEGASAAPAVVAPVAEAAPAVAATDAPPASAPVSTGRVKASPVARKIAAERGIDLATITGTGPGGRITRADVEGLSAAPTATPSASPVVATASSVAPVTLSGEDIPLSSMRQAIARVTVRSKTENPHYYIDLSIDMTQAMSVRQGLNEEVGDAGPRISVNDMIVRACVKAISKYPKLNTTFADDHLIAHADINIGIAIALEVGLMVPAIMRTQNMSLLEISAATKDLANRVRGEGGSLSQEENTAGTFSISNMGMLGVDNFQAIIVPPQSAILAVGAVSPTPVVRDGEIVVRQMMKASLSADHRVTDGAEGGVFLGEIRRLLENPVSLLV